MRPLRFLLGRRACAALATAACCAVLVSCGTDAPPAPGPASPTAGSSPAPTAPVTTPRIGASQVTATAAPGGASTAPVTPVTAPAPGNGTAADRAAVETVFRAYLRAVADGDFTTACGLNAPETNQRLLDELARRGTPAPTCEQAIATLYAGAGVAQGAATIADTLSVQRVDVDGDAATVAWSVEVSGRRPVVTNALRRVDGQWRLLPTPDPAG
jgi:predicted lipid-binding transport protein (Tim44 family)